MDKPLCISRNFCTIRLLLRTLRSCEEDLLSFPYSRLKTKGDWAFSVAAPTLWNSLPLWLKIVDTVVAFKAQLKTYIFESAFNVIFLEFFLIYHLFLFIVMKHFMITILKSAINKVLLT